MCPLISTAVVDNFLMNGCECYNVTTVNVCSCCLSLHGAVKGRGDILVFCLLFSGIYGYRSSTSTCNQAQCVICVERFASCAILMSVLSHYVCSVGEFLGLFGILLLLVLVGRAAFVFPLSALSNYWTKSPTTKISLRHQVPTANLCMDGCFLIESFLLCGMCSLVTHYKIWIKRFQHKGWTVYEELRTTWIKSLGKPVIDQELLCVLVLIQNFR